jgi:MFS transporter, DHA1 family, multidrug resistance protein
MSAADAPQGSRRALIAILIVVSIINPLGVNMFVPAMPAIMRALSTDLASIQLVLSAYLFATAAAQLVLGPLSDRLGRRPVLLGGLILFVAASLVCTLAPSIEVLIVARVLQGMGGCVGIVLGRAMIRDRFERNEAASMLGYVTMGFAVAPMFGPALGGILNDSIGWRSIFGFLAALGAIVTTAAIFALPETRRPHDPGAPTPGLARSFAILGRLPAFWAYALNVAFTTGVFFSFLGGTPFVAIDILGMTGTEYGIYFAFVPGGFILGNFLTARYSARLGIQPMLIAGSTIALIAVIAMALAFAVGWYHPLSLFVPMYAIGFSNGLTLANALAGAVSVRPAIAGAASGLAGSLQLGVGGAATVIVGALLGAVHSVFPLIAVMALFAAGALAAALWSRSARTA